MLLSRTANAPTNRRAMIYVESKVEIASIGGKRRSAEIDLARGKIRDACVGMGDIRVPWETFA